MDLETPQLSPQDVARIVRRIERPVVLVGMMGVGKSTVGRKLATMMHAPFIDADDEIERAAQMSIPDIFANYGEPYFRDGERRVIARLLNEGASRGRMALATGGGAFCDAETRELILDKAIAVWLDCDINTLVERTARKDSRPLLRQGDPREILTRLRDERAPFYAQAPIHVMSGNAPHQHTALRILKAIDQWL